MPSTCEIIQSTLRQPLVDEDDKPIHLQLLPGLTAEEVNDFARSLPTPPSDDVRELLKFCSGINGALEQIDFTGRTLNDAFELDLLIPHALTIAADGFGNCWVVDLQPGSSNWGPIYFCCHDAPVILVQAISVQQFVVEVLKMYIPPHQSLINDVHEDRVFDVWRKNPGVMAGADALVSPDADIRTFAGGLDDRFEVIDLRDAPIGMGFSWGRYGPKTEVVRFGAKPIFAYRRPEKTGLLSKLFGR